MIVQYAALVAFAFAFIGCFQSVLLNSSEIQNSNEDNIVVSTKDGRQISFDSREYNITADDSGRQVVRGKGKLYRQGESQFESFEGGIPVDDIDRISKSEKTTMFYASIIAAAAVVGYALIWALALNGRGFGG